MLYKNLFHVFLFGQKELHNDEVDILGSHPSVLMQPDATCFCVTLTTSSHLSIFSLSVPFLDKCNSDTLLSISHQQYHCIAVS